MAEKADWDLTITYFLSPAMLLEEIIYEIPTSEPHRTDLINYLPSYYSDSAIMRSIQDASTQEMSAVYSFINDIKEQILTPVTATWGLDFWEQELGLKVDISKTYEERREVILARLRGLAATGKSVLKNAADAFSGGDADIIEYPPEHRFVIKFTGTVGIPRNMDRFIEMVEDLKPAHLAYSFEYIFTWWNKLKELELSWLQASMGTWDDLKVYDP